MSVATVAAAAAPAIIGGLLGGSSSGGGQQQQTASKEPWGAAAPWLKDNIATGQRLQGFYQANPFNPQQQNAYRNLSAGTNYINQITPSLLQQMSRQQGFDRTNPRAMPQAYNFGSRQPEVSSMAQSYADSGGGGGSFGFFGGLGAPTPTNASNAPSGQNLGYGPSTSAYMPMGDMNQSGATVASQAPPKPAAPDLSDSEAFAKAYGKFWADSIARSPDTSGG